MNNTTASIGALESPETATRRNAVPRSLGNIAIFCLIALLVRRFVQVHFAVGLSVGEAIGIPIAIGLAGVLLKHMPKEAQDWTAAAAASTLSAKRSTRIALGVFLLVIMISASVTTVEVDWTGVQAVEILKNGSRIASRSTADHPSLVFFVTAFRPVSVAVKSYVSTLRPWPLKRSLITIPFYVTASDVPELGAIENYLDLALLQNNQARYVSEATKRIEHLRHASTIGSADALERLDDIANIIQQSLVEARTNDVKEHLLDVYEAKYPLDSWLPVLRSVVAFSNAQYEKASDAIQSAGDSGARWPRPSTVRFVNATSQLRLANQLRVSDRDRDRATAALAKAQQEYDKVVTEMLRNGDHEYVTMVRPAAYVFQGITSFYQRDYHAAETDFETVLRLDDADNALKARAANGIGYLAFLRGDMDQASRGFNRALEYDGAIAIARVNQGLMLLVKGQFDAAQSHFGRLLNDERIKLRSPRDVLLARLGLAHALDWQDKSNEALVIYTDVLASLDRHDFSEVQSRELRLAYVYDAIGSKIYLLNKDYFSLEPFALATFGRSCEYYCAIDSSADSGAIESKADLGQRLNANITKALAFTPRDWNDAYQTTGGMLGTIRRVAGGKCSCQSPPKLDSDNRSQHN